MTAIVDWVLVPEIALDPLALHQHLCHFLQIEAEASVHWRVLRRSIDARNRQIKVNIRIEYSLDEPLNERVKYQKPKILSNIQSQAIIVGAGPAGLFAALMLLEHGVKPIILERGQDVRTRRRALAAINKDHVVDPDSNYCFGEGGAGTYSDGKLYTRSTKRGDIQRILEILVVHGAPEDILSDAHPHIGTNKLPQLIEAMRETILQAGGEIHFNQKVNDFHIEKGSIRAVSTVQGKTIEGIGCILSTGHSARDIFHLLERKGILIEAKPFALGVRIEHAQSTIDQAQYHRPDRGPLLPAASYSLVTQAPYKGIAKGVFSFCMCPGGFIVPSATEDGEIVVNGMSPSRRDSKYANSGVVVSVDPEDWAPLNKEFGVLAALEYQRRVEKKAYSEVKEGQKAPAQRVSDYLKSKVSKDLPDTSYQPGLVSTDLRAVLPESIGHRLQIGIQAFGQKIQNYTHHEAVMVGVESRTSSPVRIPRDSETCEHPTCQRLFPCGEGAGYAGGIVSAAMDGERCALALIKKYV